MNNMREAHQKKIVAFESGNMQILRQKVCRLRASPREVCLPAPCATESLPSRRCHGRPREPAVRRREKTRLPTPMFPRRGSPLSRAPPLARHWRPNRNRFESGPGSRLKYFWNLTLVKDVKKLKNVPKIFLEFSLKHVRIKSNWFTFQNQLEV